MTRNEFLCMVVASPLAVLFRKKKKAEFTLVWSGIRAYPMEMINGRLVVVSDNDYEYYHGGAYR